MQPLDQTIRVIFTLIQSHKANHALQDAGAEGIGVTLPALCQHGQGFFVKVCAVGFVLLESRADAAIVAEKTAAKEQIETEIAALSDNISVLKEQLKSKKSALKVAAKELSKAEAKKVAAEKKAAEESKKAEAESVLKKLLASGMSADEIVAKLQ